MSSYVLTSEQQKLVEDNMKLVPYTLLKYCGYEACMDEDLNSIGMIGLCNAAATFDIDKGYSFSTYAIKCIYTKVMTEFRKTRTMKRSPDEPLLSLNYIILSEDGEEDEFVNFIPDQNSNTEREVINKILYEQALPYVPTFAMMEEEGLSLSEIAKREHRSKQGIHLRLQKEYRMAHDILTGKRSHDSSNVASNKSA